MVPRRSRVVCVVEVMNPVYVSSITQMPTQGLKQAPTEGPTERLTLHDLTKLACMTAAPASRGVAQQQNSLHQSSSRPGDTQ